MIEYIKGDLLSWPNNINVILHGCNTQGKMKSGLAKQISEKYPKAVEVDQYALKYGENKLGRFSVAILDDEKRIINGYIQDEIGTEKRRVNYESLYQILEMLEQILSNANKNEGKNYILGIPAIGCGLAGGDIRILKAMLEVVFKESELKVYFVEYEQKLLT